METFYSCHYTVDGVGTTTVVSRKFSLPLEQQRKYDLAPLKNRTIQIIWKKE